MEIINAAAAIKPAIRRSASKIKGCSRPAIRMLIQHCSSLPGRYSLVLTVAAALKVCSATHRPPNPRNAALRTKDKPWLESSERHRHPLVNSSKPVKIRRKTGGRYQRHHLLIMLIKTRISMTQPQISAIPRRLHRSASGRLTAVGGRLLPSSLFFGPSSRAVIRQLRIWIPQSSHGIRGL